MYVPGIYREENQDNIVSFIKANSFGTIISACDNVPSATHLPFAVVHTDNTIKLYSHFARANDHWKQLVNETVLIIFLGPHGYISPSWYHKPENVPTWNYVAVHAYGTVHILNDAEEIIKCLERSIMSFEPGYLQQWQQFPESYKSKMMNGITAFEVAVTRLQAVKKLSQNKTPAERSNIVHNLSISGLSPENELARYMKQEFDF